MGAQLNKACVDCRKDYYLGYSSYGHHHVLNERFPAAEHEGHNVLQYNEDFTHLEGDDLMLEGQFDSELYIPDLRNFEHFDLSGEK